MNKINSNFSDLGVSAKMGETLSKVGYTTPTPIQSQSIPQILTGEDFLGQAQTGTGKTAAFGVPLIERIDISKAHVQGLIVCPTRELCIQVEEEFAKWSVHDEGLSSIALYGGQPIDKQIRKIRSQSPQILVATPGRLFDHLRRKTVDISKVKAIVLDEADEMLDMGFKPEIEGIFELIPSDAQRVFFSATMPKSMEDLAYTYLRDPKIAKIASKKVTAEKINQSYIKALAKEKVGVLCRLLDFHDPKLAVIFCNSKSMIDELVEELNVLGFDSGALHGDLSQSQRDRVMAGFRSSQIKILVATDIAARGIDITDVELVLNYHLPHDPEDYVHRIGRTGRAGKEGRAISLVEPRDNSRLRRISSFAKIQIPEKALPSLVDTKNAKVEKLFAKVKASLNVENSSVEEYRSILDKNDLSAEDFAAGLLKLMLEKFQERNKREIHLKGFSDFPDKKEKFGGGSKRRRFGNKSRGGFSSSSSAPRRNSSPASSSRGKRNPRGDMFSGKPGEFSFNRPKKSRGNYSHQQR